MLRPYPAYVDTGVEWLGKVPEPWAQLPGKACYREKKTPNAGMRESKVLSLSYGKIVVKPTDTLHGLVPESFETYQIIEPRDIVVRPTDLQNDWNSLRFALSLERGIITSAYMCLQTRGVITPEFAHLLLHAYDVKKVFYGLGSGLRQNLDWRDFKYLPCLVPPLLEQAAIVRYLDRIDLRVRRYIRAKQRLITLLHEQKRVIIHRAVTRGFDVDGPSKPSDVEWLADVPQEWEVVRLRHLIQGHLANGIFKRKDSFGRGVPLVNVKDIYSDDFAVRHDDLELVDASPAEVRSFRAQAGDIFFVRSSLKLDGTGRSALAGDCEDSTVFECHLVRARPRGSLISPRFLTLFLNSPVARDYLVSRASTVTMSTLPQGVIAAMDVVVPPRGEQDRIVEVTDREAGDIAAAIASASRNIGLVLEYRTGLIADVVTGKLDVREAAARLPDEIEAAEPLDDADALTEGDDLGEQGDVNDSLEEVEA